MGLDGYRQRWDAYRLLTVFVEPVEDLLLWWPRVWARTGIPESFPTTVTQPGFKYARCSFETIRLG